MKEKSGRQKSWLKNLLSPVVTGWQLDVADTIKAAMFKRWREFRERSVENIAECKVGMYNKKE